MMYRTLHRSMMRSLQSPWRSFLLCCHCRLTHRIVLGGNDTAVLPHCNYNIRGDKRKSRMLLIRLRLQTWFLLLAILVLLSISWSYTEYVSDIIPIIITESEDALAPDGRRVPHSNSQVSPELPETNVTVTVAASNTSSTDALLLQLRSPRNIFDCGPNVQNVTCVYFDPSTYFHRHATTSPLGLPPDILDSVQNYWSNKVKLSSNENDKLFWFSILQDIGVYSLLEWNGDDSPPSSLSSSPPKGWPRTLMGLHIHKCGGSSVGRTFLRVSRRTSSDGGNNYNHTLFYRNDLRAKYGEDGVEEQSVALHRRLVKQIYDNQQIDAMLSSTTATHSDHVAFTFVREPVERFMSSVREFLVGRNRHRLCLEALTSRDFLMCILAHLRQEHGLQLDQHFAPATVSFYMFSRLEPKMKISVLPLTSDTMAAFQSTFLGPQSRTIKLKSSKPRKYNVTMDELDIDMTRDICHLYAMDVRLLRYLGMPVPLCDDSV